MPQVCFQLSDQLHELLIRLSDKTGNSKSSLCAEFVKEGIYKEIQNQKQIEEFLSRETPKT